MAKDEKTNKAADDTELPHIFGKPDRHPIKGHIWSHVPSYQMERHIEEMEEEILRDESLIKRGMVPQDKIMIAQESLAKRKERLADIKSAKPKLTPKHEERFDKSRKWAIDYYRDNIPTRDEMRLGFVDPHIELKKCKDLKIPVPDVEVAKRCNIPLDGNKTNRDGVATMIKILNPFFGESTNLERYRRDGLTHKTSGRVHNLTIEDIINQKGV